ncbi:NADH-quinone oxidoreductase subunit C [uncultured Nostoc sp.]
MWKTADWQERESYDMYGIDISENECRDVAVLRLYKDSG